MHISDNYITYPEQSAIYKRTQNESKHTSNNRPITRTTNGSSACETIANFAYALSTINKSLAGSKSERFCIVRQHDKRNIRRGNNLSQVYTLIYAAVVSAAVTFYCRRRLYVLLLVLNWWWSSRKGNGRCYDPEYGSCFLLGFVCPEKYAYMLVLLRDTCQTT